MGMEVNGQDWLEGDVKEPTLLFEKNRGRRPRWCGLPLMGGRGLSWARSNWLHAVVVTLPMYKGENDFKNQLNISAIELTQGKHQF